MEGTGANIELNNDFTNVIGTVFNNWTGLKLVVEHGSGGTPMEMKRKIESLVSSVNNILINNGDRYDLIEELETVLDEEFSTIVEDDSCEEVSDELINLYGFWTTNSLDSVVARLNTFKVKESIMVPLSRIGVRNVPRVVHSDSDNGLDDNDQNQDERMDDDSEWTVVSRKKK